ncbi:uncharacterized protein At5g19025-like [Carica papaya]|uniref:uncharacterized protein At5g19025-like n=1 Tax=Carica papaya TaxID=3649 RepID=UPI000B8D0F35|nr:uncharacterized protein At5g19025-like [Carica papaya]
MLHLLLPPSSATSMRSTSSKPTSKSSPNSNNPSHGNPHSLLLCKHSPSATLDLLILILVLFSGTFLLCSYLSYLFNSLSLLLSQFPSLSLSLPTFFPLLSSFNPQNGDDTNGYDTSLPPASYFFAFTLFFAAFIAFLDSCCGTRSRKCRNPGCKGLKKAMEFDLQLQTEDCVKSGLSKEIDGLPWKGGSESNPDYECLRAELRKMAPPNGRAVLLFRSRCGCPVAKLEGWGPKRGRRHKKALGNTTHSGGDSR